ncbi:hypothetical protein EYF80_063699 [Liparis tanakae]|uniref:Uncharacterized protein n=1 Tax=Liparis tanakae TaxID=230148 RepID=A0A4Z2EBQ7_9TELE|nr:hypothetical protein EYF80_063699 [Liparis tanakae]
MRPDRILSFFFSGKETRVPEPRPRGNKAPGLGPPRALWTQFSGSAPRSGGGEPRRRDPGGDGEAGGVHPDQTHVSHPAPSLRDRLHGGVQPPSHADANHHGMQGDRSGAAGHRPGVSAGAPPTCRAVPGGEGELRALGAHVRSGAGRHHQLHQPAL